MVAAVKYKWDNNVAHQFQNTVMKNMGSMKISKPVGDSSQESIDNLASDLNDFFHRCANEANIIKSKMVAGNHRKPLKNKSKKWFTPTLSNLKKSCLTGQNIYVPLHMIKINVNYFIQRRKNTNS